jgi:cytoskeletal protein CcmA (bactofilin family)
MKSSKNTNGTTPDSFVSKGVEISGDMLFSGILQVDGKVVGTLTSAEGSLMIEQTGEVDAQVDVAICVIRGRFKGNVKAKSRVEVYKTATVDGEIATPVLLIEEGAQCNAAIIMAQKAQAKGQA